jgi:hypothetical protein
MGNKMVIIEDAEELLPEVEQVMAQIRGIS